MRSEASGYRKAKTRQKMSVTLSIPVAGRQQVGSRWVVGRGEHGVEGGMMLRIH